MDLVQKALVGQNVTTGSPMYKYMERVLKGDVKLKVSQQENLVGSCTVTNFNIVIATMTVHNFPALAYQDQKRPLRRYLWKPKEMKVITFTTRFIQLNNNLPSFPPDHVRQMITSNPDEDIKEILYHGIPNLCRKKLTEQGYNYLNPCPRNRLKSLLSFFLDPFLDFVLFL